MRAHFAGDVVSGTSDDRFEIDRNKSKPLEVRIDTFKQDSKNMDALVHFIDEVLQKAEEEALKKQQQKESSGSKNGKSSQQPKEKSRQSFAIPDFKNGKVVNRARGLVVRIFDAICNCANTAAAAPAQRLKLRGKRGASTANGDGGGGDGENANKTVENSNVEKDGGGGSSGGGAVGVTFKDNKTKEASQE